MAITDQSRSVTALSAKGEQEARTALPLSFLATMSTLKEKRPNTRDHPTAATPLRFTSVPGAAALYFGSLLVNRIWWPSPSGRSRTRLSPRQRRVFI